MCRKLCENKCTITTTKDDDKCPPHSWGLYVVTFYPETGCRRDKFVELNHDEVTKAEEQEPSDEREHAREHLITVASGMFYRRGRRIVWNQLRFTVLPGDNAPAVDPRI